MITKEDKELMIKDLCARLPYGVKIKSIKQRADACQAEVSFTEKLDVYTLKLMMEFKEEGFPFFLNKPYLFPLSSMTKEQEEELEEMGLAYYDGGEIMTEDGKIIYGRKTFQLIPCTETDDWLLEHHFDLRGLIKKGLAIDATYERVY